MLLILFFLSINNKDIYDRFISTNLEEIKTIDSLYIPLPDHYQLIISAYLIFKDNIIFGIGPNMFRHKCNDDKYFLEGKDFFDLPEIYEVPINNFQAKQNSRHSRLMTLDSCSTHPHNLHLQILAETGLIGYFLFISILYLLYKGYKEEKNILYKNFNKLMLISIIINFFPFAPSGNFFSSYFSFIIFLPIIFLLLKKNYET